MSDQAHDATDGKGNQRDDAGLLLVFAHPDDETFGCAGLMAAATTRGLPVTLISATRGEAGKTGDPALDTAEILGAVREQELRAAAAISGVTDVRFLDYRDSGMANTPENDDPRALMQAADDDVAAKLVIHLRAVRPATVVTFGPEGIYGHPDHVAIHRSATIAVHQAADPTYRPEVGPAWQTRALYYSAVPRERFLAMLDRPDGPLEELSAEARQRVGTPRAEITTVIDVAAYRDRKRAAIAAHRSQTGEGGPLAGIPEEQRELTLGREHFVRVPLPWDAAGAPNADVVADLAAERPVDPA